MFKLLKMFFCLILLTSCQVSGRYEYSKEGLSEKHKNETVLTYNGNIKNLPFKIYHKINFDPNNTDKPPYYEVSHELWFW
jgi:hypothetical protein